MSTFVIPSVFTAIDKVTAPIRKMIRSVNKFIGVSESGIARQERLFRKLTPALSQAGKQLLSYASAAAIAGGIIGTISFSTDQMMAYEKGLASFRTIVSDLSDDAFGEFRKQINLVAKDTQKSSVDVVSSFEKIAGLNADFAKTAEGLGAVSKAAIILAKASGDELGPSAESLVGIMNQFGFAANQADRAINVLAAGQAVGAANIQQTAEALSVFGAVAKSSNTTLEQSVGLIEVLAAKSIKGSEAGTALRGAFVRLQKAGMGYKSGQFQINDALEQARKKVHSLRTAKEKDAFITKLFGLENLTAGKILLDNIGKFNEFTQAVTGTSEAQKAAKINSTTLGDAIDRMKAKWVNMITSSNEAGSALENAKKIIGFLTDNMETIVSVGTKVLMFFALWKAAIIAQKAVMLGYNIVLGVNAAITGVMPITMGKNAVALGIYNGIVKGATAVQWLWNAALSANPIGLIIIAIAALIGLIVVVIKHWDSWGAAVAFFMGPLGMVISLFKTLYDDWELIKKAFKTNGITGALKAIGRSILDSILSPLQQVLEIAAKLPGIGDWAQRGADNIKHFRDGMYGYDNNEESTGAVRVDPSNGPLGLINPKLVKMQSEQTVNNNNTSKQQVSIDINDKSGRAKVKRNTGGVPIVLTKTTGQF